ncbi:DUF2851 family protein [Puniceicoccaceae bacterium K14]|nr:DUF2851 family protein [Puniceicoccaceae bacterium K14]
MSASDYPSIVEEFQGIYGPYQVNERVLQKIWLEGAFDDRNLVDSDGRKIAIHFPGHWNRLAGPDFKGAVLFIDGVYTEGDVEIHFGLKDWYAHSHQLNPSFDKVILHVVYHPILGVELGVMNSQKKSIPALSLMERLWYGLEEYATYDSLMESTGMDARDAVEDLLILSVEERRRLLIGEAEDRWRSKVAFAAMRIDKLGWDDACHQTALEILGFRFNRAAMLRVAGAFDFRTIVSTRVDLETMWESGGGRWRQRGSRPANQPKVRLGQYLEWVRQVSDWPSRLREIPINSENISIEAVGARKALGIKELKEWISKEVVGDQVSGTRLDTLVCDGFLPLLAASLEVDLFSLWFHWYLGDLPDFCLESMKRLQVAEGRNFPKSNGWGQGVLQKTGLQRITPAAL